MKVKERYPLVSLLIANYNNGEFIIDTLNSAIGQTYPNIEIIIVDDASTDNSINIIRKFKEEHSEFKIDIYQNFFTYGCGRNKRKCVDIVRGSYFAFLDPEDTIESIAVEVLMRAHLENIGKYSIVYSTHYLCDEKLNILSISDWPGEIPNSQSHLTSNEGHISAFAVCSKYFYDKTSGINPEYIVAEDMDLYLKMEEVAPVLFINKPIYYYRKHDNNLSWSYDKRYQNLYWRHKAELAAYHRRKKNKTIAVNLKKSQYKRRKFLFYMQYAKMYRNRKIYIKSIKYNFKALLYVCYYFKKNNV